ncbi:MAG: FG-GAP-like repeat-containing protein [Phycisphaera sp.]|nr:MAG: FG-GAP-like repeat-containing protein [Phycisphaera sp.]
MPRLAILLGPLLALTTTGVALAQAPCADPDAICLRDLDGTDGVRFDGTDPLGQAGESVAFAGDLNGDGIDDLAVGEPDAGGGDGGPGAVYFVYGRATPFAAQESLEALPGGVGTRVTPPAGVVGLGFYLARIGDLDGDGYDDLAIGCFDRTESIGRAYVLFGREGGFPASISLDDPGVRTLALASGSPLSVAAVTVASAGDFNADGRPDLALGAANAGAGGEAYVIWGRDVPGGDDPFPDALTLGSWPASVGMTLRGGPGQSAGASIAGAPVGMTGDANGDGVDDLLVGAPRTSPAGRDGAGRVYLVFGSPDHGRGGSSIDLPSMPLSAGVRFDALEERTSMSPAFLGDLNGDGRDDFGFFSPSYGPSGSVDGRAWIRFGRAPGDGFLPIEPLWVLDASRGVELSANFEGTRYFGSSAAAIGDFDGDGLDDALIGAALTGFSPFISSAGRGLVLRGARTWPGRLELGTSRDRFVSIDGYMQQHYVATSVAGLGDLNGDGLDDLVLGGPGRPGSGGNPGAAFVVFGGAAGGPPCAADIDRDGALTVFDFLAFQNLFDDGDPRADLDGDGELTLFDFLAFQTAFDAGC